MNVTIEAAAMVAQAAMPEATVEVQIKVLSLQRFVRNESAASVAVPSVSGHSLSAVTPDSFFDWRLAKAA